MKPHESEREAIARELEDRRSWKEHDVVVTITLKVRAPADADEAELERRVDECMWRVVDAGIAEVQRVERM